MTMPPNERQRENILDTYFKEVYHLYELGIIGISEDGESVIISPTGRNAFLQDRKAQNGNPMEAS